MNKTEYESITFLQYGRQVLSYSLDWINYLRDLTWASCNVFYTTWLKPAGQKPRNRQMLNPPNFASLSMKTIVNEDRLETCLNGNGGQVANE